MSESVRPEVQKFFAQLRHFIGKLDAESNANNAETKRKHDIIVEKLKTASVGDSHLELLTKSYNELKTVSNCLDRPLREFTTLEEHYKNLLVEEERKMEEAKKRKTEMLIDKPSSEIDDIMAIHDDINFKLSELVGTHEIQRKKVQTLASRGSQRESLSEQRRRLTDQVFEIEEEVVDLVRALETKIEQLRNCGQYCTHRTDRDVATQMVISSYKKIKSMFVVKKLHMHQLKQKYGD